MPSNEIQPLLLRVADGDAGALAELYDATVLFVFGILRRMLWNSESAALPSPSTSEAASAALAGFRP